MSLSHVRPDVRQQTVFTAAILAGDSWDNTAVSNETNQGRVHLRSKSAQMLVTGKSVTHKMKTCTGSSEKGPDNTIN